MDRDDPPQGGMQGLIQWLMWFMVRPGGFTGGAGRSQQIGDVMKLTLAQIVFFAHERTASSGNAKEDIDAKWNDPEFREQYSRNAKRAIEKAKARLAR